MGDIVQRPVVSDSQAPPSILVVQLMLLWVSASQAIAQSSSSMVSGSFQPSMQSSSNILLYPYSHCVNSHLLNMEKLAAVLLAGGHNVTMLVADTYDGPYSGEDLSAMSTLRYRAPDGVRVICDYESLQSFLSTPVRELIRRFYRSTLLYCDALLNDRAMLHELKLRHFDLAIYDAVDQCSKVLAGYLDVHFIAFHTHGLDTVLPLNPAYLPAILTSFSDDMSFVQRVANTGAYLLQRGISLLSTKFYEDLRLTHKHLLANHDVTSLADVFNRASLKFVLGDFGLDYVRSIQPTTILVGGVIQGTSRVVPLHLQRYLDEATEGVVLFSFGSLMRTYDAHWQDVFFSALARLPYKVLWKFMGNITRPVPDNVELVQWLPQAEVLGHRNVRAFISHCGWNSAYESAYNGVPMVAIPLFGDQFFQATKITERARMGVQLDINTVTADRLYEAVISVATEPLYRVNARYISNMMTTKLRSQKEEILYWVDFVTRLNGTHYLKSKETNLSWYQLLLLDVFFIVSVTTVVLMACLRWLSSRMLNYLFFSIKRKMD